MNKVKIDITRVLISRDGEPIPDKVIHLCTECREKGVEETISDEMTLGTVMQEALLAVDKKAKKGEHKKRFKLFNRICRAEDDEKSIVEFEPKEIETITDLIPKAYNGPIVAGQACAMLDGEMDEDVEEEPEEEETEEEEEEEEDNG